MGAGAAAKEAAREVGRSRIIGARPYGICDGGATCGSRSMYSRVITTCLAPIYVYCVAVLSG